MNELSCFENCLSCSSPYFFTGAIHVSGLTLNTYCVHNFHLQKVYDRYNCYLFSFSINIGKPLPLYTGICQAPMQHSRVIMYSFEPVCTFCWRYEFSHACMEFLSVFCAMLLSCIAWFFILFAIYSLLTQYFF